jgi:hypothetical protein
VPIDIWDRRGEEIKATLKARQEKQDWRYRRFEQPPLASGQNAHPPCPAASRPSLFPRVLVCQLDGKKTDEIEQMPRLDRKLVVPKCRIQLHLPNPVTIRRRGSSLVPCPATAAILIAQQSPFQRPVLKHHANPRSATIGGHAVIPACVSLPTSKCKHPLDETAEGCICHMVFARFDRCSQSSARQEKPPSFHLHQVVTR